MGFWNSVTKPFKQTGKGIAAVGKFGFKTVKGTVKGTGKFVKGVGRFGKSAGDIALRGAGGAVDLGLNLGNTLSNPLVLIAGGLAVVIVLPQLMSARRGF